MLWGVLPINRPSVTNISYRRMGENGPGVANGVTSTGTTNLLGGVLTVVSTADYTTNISDTATNRADSTVGFQFTTGRYGTTRISAQTLNPALLQ